jgi:hypothetical protein
MHLKKSEADLLAKTIKLLERLSIKRGQEEAMVCAVELASELQQAIIDGKPASQRTKRHKDKHLSIEPKLTDEDLRKRLHALRRGREIQLERLRDSREEM